MFYSIATYSRLHIPQDSTPESRLTLEGISKENLKLRERALGRQTLEYKENEVPSMYLYEPSAHSGTGQARYNRYKTLLRVFDLLTYTAFIHCGAGSRIPKATISW